MITIGVLKEPSFESRASLLAVEVAALIKSGMAVWIETGAGVKVFCPDADYVTAGGVIKSRTDMMSTADVLLSINYNDIDTSVKDRVLIGESNGTGQITFPRTPKWHPKFRQLPDYRELPSR